MITLKHDKLAQGVALIQEANNDSIRHGGTNLHVRPAQNARTAQHENNGIVAVKHSTAINAGPSLRRNEIFDLSPLLVMNK